MLLNKNNSNKALRIFSLLLSCIAIGIISFSFHVTNTNTGVSFGIGRGERFVPYLILALIVFLLYEFLKLEKFEYSLLFIISGGIVNLIDRITNNGVGDYLSFLGLWSFNLPDVFIVLGSIWWIFDLIMSIIYHPKYSAPIERNV